MSCLVNGVHQFSKGLRAYIASLHARERMLHLFAAPCVLNVVCAALRDLHARLRKRTFLTYVQQCVLGMRAPSCVLEVFGSAGARAQCARAQSAVCCKSDT